MYACCQYVGVLEYIGTFVFFRFRQHYEYLEQLIAETAHEKTCYEVGRVVHNINVTTYFYIIRKIDYICGLHIINNKAKCLVK